MSAASTINDSDTVIMTPTTSTRCSSEDGDSIRTMTPTAPILVSSAPRGNKIYKIRHRSTGRYLSLSGGFLYLAAEYEMDLPFYGCLWQCIESCGWLNFYEVASGRYLSADNNGSFCCFSLDHDGQMDNFQVVTYEWDPKRDGEEDGGRGTETHITTLDGYYMKRIGVDDQTNLIRVNNVAQAASWDFFEI